ncbi:MAG TPA: hypothetical protein PKG59_20210 [Spirochaetota bacterium]|nr:hypothetical protein [Spirochaetota bacterium]
MFSSGMVQDVQKCFPDLYSPNDPDLVLISDYSIFRSGTLELINDLFEELGTYGLISGIPSDVLFVFQKRFESYLNIFPDLRDRLTSSVADITRKLSNAREEVGPGSFIEWLYSKKRRRTLAKISYYDFINEMVGYIHHFLLSKVN